MKLWYYLKGYRKKAFLGGFFKLIEAIFELTLPMLMAVLIDQGIQKNNNEIIIQMSLIMLVLTILGYLASIICQYYASDVAQKYGGRLRSALFEKINSFSFEELDIYSSATLSNRMINDINQIQWAIAMVIRLAIRAPFLMLGSLFATWMIRPELAQTLLISMPIFALVLWLIMMGSMKIYQRAQTQLDRLGRIVQDYLQGVRIIRSFAKNKSEKERFDDHNGKMNRLLKRMGIVSSLSSPITTLLMNMVLLLMISQGAQIAQTGGIEQGELIAIINYCMQMIMALVIFMNLVLLFSRAFAARKRVLAVLNQEVKMKATIDPKPLKEGSMSITFKNVSFYYPNSKHPSLKNINLSIEESQMVGVVGLTGSGKSTLIQLMARFYDTSEGSVEINGNNIKDYDFHELRENIGYVAQGSTMLSGDVFENLVMGGKISVEAIEDALVVAQADAILDGKEDGLYSSVQKGGGNFSGGQKQRFNIARAVAKTPSLLILDDSFSALDYATDKRLREALKQRIHKMTTIFVSQRISSVKSADQIIVLDEGELLDVGKHEDLLQRCSLYKQMYDSQLQEVEYER